MSFADELRNYDAGPEQSRIIQSNLKNDVSLLVGLLKQACKEANTSHKRSVSIFCISYDSDGYIETGYIEQLPNAQQTIAELKKLYKHYDGAPFRKEQQLYQRLIRFDSSRLEYVKILQKQLNDEVSKMGFSTWKVALVELDDIWIIHSRKSFTFSRLSESITTRNDGKIYTFNLQASW